MEERDNNNFESENGENNNESPQWYVVYTVPRSEKRVNDRFVDERIESYMPTYRTIRQWSDRKKSVEVPLFNSYVFVRVLENELFKVLKIPGVVKLVYYLTKPAIVRQKEIDSIKEFLRQTEGYSYTIKKGDKVEISSGLLQGVYGEVIRIGKTKIVIQIEQLGATLIATVPRGQLKKPAFVEK